MAGDPKTARKQQRERRNELYALQRQAMETGDPKLAKYMPIRDQGPARRFVRDYVDARFSVGEIFLPIAFLILIVMMVGAAYPDIALTLTTAMYLLVLLGLIDGFIVSFLVGRHLKKRFDDEEIPKWTKMYAFSRAFMVRRFRQPRPMVKRGEWPHKERKEKNA